MHLYLCMNAHKWICLFLGKAQSSFSYHSCARHSAATRATTLSARLWLPAGLGKCAALPAGASSSHESETIATALGISFRSQSDVLSCMWIIRTGGKKDILVVHSLGCAERGSMSPVPCSSGRGCTSQDSGEDLWRWGCNSHIFLVTASSGIFQNVGRCRRTHWPWCPLKTPSTWDLKMHLF